MKPKILALMLCLALILSACHTPVTRLDMDGASPSGTSPEEKSSPSEIQFSSERESVPQLLMIYMVGSSLESDSGLASADLSEIMGSGFDPENMTILICAGGTSYWWTEQIDADGCSVYKVSPGNLDRVYTMSGENMAAPATLAEFIDYGYANYHADSYNMIFWDHGGGAVLGFGLDENHGNDALTLAEMDEALQNTAFIRDGKGFGWVGFDACLMGMMEVADLFSDYADYLIASEEQEPADGWNYGFLKTISRENIQLGSDAAEVILEQYRGYYETCYKYTPDYTLSCLDLSYTDSVVSGLKELIRKAAQELQNGGYSRIAKLRTQAKSFGKTTDAGIYDAVDLYDLAERLAVLFPGEAANVQNALNKLVAHNVSNVSGAHGVAIYFPYENKEYAERWMEIYKTTGFCDEYITFLQSFAGILSGGQLTPWDISEVVPEEDPQQSGNYYVQLTEDQLANFASAKYSIWEEDTPGSYICWIDSRDTSVSEDGRVCSGFEGNFFYIGDTGGNLLPCCAMEIERNEDYVKYAIPVMVLPADDPAGFVLQGAFLHLRVDAAHPDGEIIGIYKTMEADSSLFPNRDMAEISQGDYVYPFYFARQIVTREDGSLAPFAEWTSSSDLGSGFAVSGDLRITMGRQEPGTEYCCLFLLTDTQGNSYFTDSTFVKR